MLDLTNEQFIVTGGSGFLGKHVVAELKNNGVPGASIFVPRAVAYDLRKETGVRNMMRKVITLGWQRPIVIHLAANVGGIGYNEKWPADLFYDNLMMGLHVLEGSRLIQAKKLVMVSTVCAYPKYTPVPFQEQRLWDGYPEETNAPYGLAKRVMLAGLRAYYDQHEFKFSYLLPANLYGPGDNFHPDSSHVIPALVRRFVRARDRELRQVRVWGDGSATREFLHVRDAARAIVLATVKYNGPEAINIGTGHALTIKQLAEMIAAIVEYPGEIIWDHSRPSGQPRRELDTNCASLYLGFEAQIGLEEGLRELVTWYEIGDEKAAAG